MLRVSLVDVTKMNDIQYGSLDATVIFLGAVQRLIAM
jgi:hypothetical protein